LFQTRAKTGSASWSDGADQALLVSPALGEEIYKVLDFYHLLRCELVKLF
jgi:hypothetical protein